MKRINIQLGNIDCGHNVLLSELQEKVKQFIEKKGKGFVITTIELECIGAYDYDEHDSCSIQVAIYRQETDAEERKRVDYKTMLAEQRKKEEARQAKNREVREKTEYLRLKAIYEK